MNFYAKSEYIGQDAVYVHLALKYYNTPGVTPWVDKAQIEMMVGVLADADRHRQEHRGDKQQAADVVGPVER